MTVSDALGVGVDGFEPCVRVLANGASEGARRAIVRRDQHGASEGRIAPQEPLVVGRARQLTEGAEVALSGNIERYRGRLQMNSPDADVLDRPSESLITGRVVPVHPSAGGVGPGWLRRAVHNALLLSRAIPDPLPDEVSTRG